MKKVLALVVAVIMMAAIAVPTFAAFEDDRSQTLVELGVGQAYVVSIPEKVTFDANLEGSATIIASSVKIAGNQTLQITVESNNYDVGEDEESDLDDSWVLKEKDGNSDDVMYMITVDGNNVVSEKTIVLAVTSNDDYTIPNDVTSGTTKTAVLSFTTEGTSQVGTYQDILSFEARVYTAPAEETPI